MSCRLRTEVTHRLARKEFNETFIPTLDDARIVSADIDERKEMRGTSDHAPLFVEWRDVKTTG